jgi:hypothetical protein
VLAAAWAVLDSPRRISMLKDCAPMPILVTAILFACSSADANQNDATNSEPMSVESEQLKSLPPLPSPTLAVPDDSQTAFHYDAVGVQIYTCQATANGYAWAFQAPEASLFDRHGHLVLKHYAGPTWESLSDHSKVVAKKVAEFSAHADAIPELLLQVTSHEGKGALADVNYIQRLRTTGGLMPTAGCDESHVGAIAHVDYTATYTFSRPKSHCK